MSAAFALIKFKRTGNIYYGCYEGTSDTMLPFICTPEECYDEKLDCYCAISYCRNLARQGKAWSFPEAAPDIDEVEIYSDYGGGFYWTVRGSESARVVESLDPLDIDIEHDGMPDWAKKFLEELENG